MSSLIEVGGLLGAESFTEHEIPDSAIKWCAEMGIAVPTVNSLEVNILRHALPHLMLGALDVPVFADFDYTAMNSARFTIDSHRNGKSFREIFFQNLDPVATQIFNSPNVIVITDREDPSNMFHRFFRNQEVLDFLTGELGLPTFNGLKRHKLDIRFPENEVKWKPLVGKIGEFGVLQTERIAQEEGYRPRMQIVADKMPIPHNLHEAGELHFAMYLSSISQRLFGINPVIDILYVRRTVAEMFGKRFSDGT